MKCQLCITLRKVTDANELTNRNYLGYCEECHMFLQRPENNTVLEKWETEHNQEKSNEC